MIYKAKCKNGEGWREGYYLQTDDILPETLCRYTEKTDINHKRIWENDIIVYEEAIGIVRYGEYYSKHLGF